jgi:hypothetical protein
MLRLALMQMVTVNHQKKQKIQHGQILRSSTLFVEKQPKQYIINPISNNAF